MNALRKVLKDPFSHFIIIGALLFALYPLVSSEDETPEQEIVISATDVVQMINNWNKRWNSAPSEVELTNLIEQQIREEIFYREALALNLDKGDAVIRRRLADKMSYLVNDVVVPPEATELQLQQFMEQNPDKFMSPIRFTFDHYYFNPDLYDEQQMQTKVAAAQEAILKGVAVNDDDFLGEKHFQSFPAHQIARLFGRHFPNELEELTLNEWSTPLVSGYGVHLVKVTQREQEELAKLADIRPYVLREWQARQQVLSNISVYEKLRAGYDIEIIMPEAMTSNGN
ncbi:peptidyl-prolyl cis-trans isomerase [Psychromonas sp. RZ22]|uniref:peptidylprolyl isomerase n=1 Tax=Psychromonas algarum TaxID=2555643 RepID=UPI0010687BD5|nr:peptidylprolyl isomerase [Psychromonas sp. RZ22]TEW56848.1 peptidyl-prolyl cis-trans isomerase [Psychromonas sp. RZ22]